MVTTYQSMLLRATVESVRAKSIYTGVLGTHHFRQVSEIAPSHSLGSCCKVRERTASQAA